MPTDILIIDVRCRPVPHKQITMLGSIFRRPLVTTCATFVLLASSASFKRPRNANTRIFCGLPKVDLSCTLSSNQNHDLTTVTVLIIGILWAYAAYLLAYPRHIYVSVSPNAFLFTISDLKATSDQPSGYPWI